MKPAVVWISIVVGLLGLSLVIQGTFLVMALNDPSFAVEPDYERKARNWDAAQRERRDSLALGWNVDLRVRPADPGEVEVELALSDRRGLPIDDGQVALQAFHNARASNVLEASLSHDSEGLYRSILPIRRSGIWEFRLTVTSGEDRWTGKVRKSVLSVPRGGASP